MVKNPRKKIITGFSHANVQPIWWERKRWGVLLMVLQAIRKRPFGGAFWKGPCGGVWLRDKFGMCIFCKSCVHHDYLYIIYIYAHTVYLYVYISNILHYIYICVCVCGGGATPVPKGYNQNYSVVRLSFNSLLAAGGDKVAAWLSPTKLHAVD